MSAHVTLSDNAVRYLREYLLPEEVDRAQHEPNYDAEDLRALREICDTIDDVEEVR